MATQLIGSASATTSFHSIQETQSGVNVESISVSTEPEFRENRLDITGHVAGQAVGETMTTISISGETIRSSSALAGLLAGDFYQEQTLALTATGGVDSGSNEFVLQNAEVTQTRGSFETCTLNYTRYNSMAVDPV